MSQSTASPMLRRLAWAFFALYIGLLLLPDFIWLHSDHDGAGWFSAIALPATLILLICALLGHRLWLACLLLSPFALLAPLESLYISRYTQPSTAEIFATLITTNSREVREYLGDALIPTCIALTTSVALTIATILLTMRCAIKWRHRSRKLALAVMFIAPPILTLTAWLTIKADLFERMQTNTSSLLANSFILGYPFGVISRVVEYHQQQQLLHKSVERLKDFSFGAHRDARGERRQIYVVVIGESSARDHWQLFGYTRPTNPELSGVTNLIPIPDMLSARTTSIGAIPLVLTRRPIEKSVTAWPEASFLRAMDEAGFDTYWISNQLSTGTFDFSTAIYTHDAKHQQFLNHASWASPGSYDGILLEPLRNTIEQTHSDLFIVLHLMGSHFFYDYRYPADFARFVPTMSTGSAHISRTDIAHYGVNSNAEELTNSYDNTILYTDHVLASVIGILRDSGMVAAMWFVSDHGEKLPSRDCADGGHGFGSRYEYQIPALFWYSDGYAKDYPQRVAAITANAKQRSLSADTFESLVDMAGVDFPGHDESRSLFNPAWRYRTRLVSRFIEADFDTATFDAKCQLVLPRKQDDATNAQQ